MYRACHDQHPETKYNFPLLSFEFPEIMVGILNNWPFSDKVENFTLYNFDYVSMGAYRLLVLLKILLEIWHRKLQMLNISKYIVQPNIVMKKYHFPNFKIFWLCEIFFMTNCSACVWPDSNDHVLCWSICLTNTNTCHSTSSHKILNWYIT